MPYDEWCDTEERLEKLVKLTVEICDFCKEPFEALSMGTVLMGMILRSFENATNNKEDSFENLLITHLVLMAETPKEGVPQKAIDALKKLFIKGMH